MRYHTSQGFVGYDMRKSANRDLEGLVGDDDGEHDYQAGTPETSLARVESVVQGSARSRVETGSGDMERVEGRQ